MPLIDTKALLKAARERRVKMKRMRAAGKSSGQIAKAFEVSRKRVEQILGPRARENETNE